jgi:integrase/recombinase XerD
MIDQLFEQYMRERIYLSQLSPHTIKHYRLSYKTYRRFVDEALPTKQSLEAFVIGMGQAGIKPCTANVYIRGVNTFLTWLAENEYIPALKIKKLKAPKPIIKTFSEAQLRILFAHKPKRFWEVRMWHLLLFLADTGCRINEALSIKRGDIDFNSLLVTVHGKGNKTRTIPFSHELRKLLYRYLQKHNFDYVFCTRQGVKLIYFNVNREFHWLTDKLGLPRTGLHSLRHTFAKNYLRNGGNLFYLQAALGHSSITTTKMYVEVETQDLQNTHARTSLLTRLR